MLLICLVVFVWLFFVCFLLFRKSCRKIDIAREITQERNLLVPSTLLASEQEYTPLVCGRKNICITEDGILTWFNSSIVSNSFQKMSSIGQEDEMAVHISSCSHISSFVFQTCAYLFMSSTNTLGILYSPKQRLKIRQIACGARNALILCEEGLFIVSLPTAMTENEERQEIHQIYMPVCQSIPIPSRVIKIACGYSHSIMSTENGLFAFGSNSQGQLGLGNAYEDIKRVKEPVAIPFFHNEIVTSFSCGKEFSVVLTRSGLYPFGCNSYGQLGLVPCDVVSLGEENTFFQDILAYIVLVSCGKDHTMVLLSTGEVLAFGGNGGGQLGQGDRRSYYRPKPVEFFEEKPVAYLDCGDFQTLFLTKDGELFFSGYDTEAPGTVGKMELLPTKVSLPSPIKTVAQRNKFARMKNARKR